MNISKKPVAIVTGASRGIGRAIALQLSKEGYGVVGVYKQSNAKAAELTLQGIDMLQADVGQETEVIRAVKHVEQAYGRIDVLVNNAGIDLFGKLESYSLADWNDMIATNLTSVFLLSKYTIPLLRHSPNASIVNLSSRLGIGEYAEPEFVPYGAIKAAINNFTVGLARELESDHIRVNAVIPTPTKTDLFDAVFTPDDEAELRANDRLGSPDEAAALVLQLINDDSLNGQLIFDERVSH